MRISTRKTGVYTSVQSHAAKATVLCIIAAFLAMINKKRYRATSSSLLTRNGSESKKDLYELPMCDIKGVCHEDPNIPSPRTEYSSKSREQHELWFRAHADLNRSAAAYSSRRSSGGSIDSKPLILLGDSITESWIGTDNGLPVDRASGVPDVLQTMAESNHLDPLVLAIGGDQTQHVMWRLQHGELLPTFADDPDSIFVLLIGTNNLGSGNLPQPTIGGVIAVMRYLLSKTRGRLISLKLLPRGDVHRVRRLCPPRCDSGGRPYASFMPAVDEVNSGLEAAAVGLAKEFGAGRFDLIDCGAAFVPAGGIGGSSEVKESLMPDRLHPNAEGHTVIADCLMNCINGTMC